MAKIVYLEGIIGVGKSTLLESLRDLGHNVVEENVEGWTLWDARCRNPQRFTFSFQVEVCLSMYERFKTAIKNCNGLIYCERSIMSSLVFALSSPESHVTYEEDVIIAKLCTRLNELLRVPTKIYFLDCDINIALERIKQRGRSGEEGITARYLEKLDKNYKNTIKPDCVINVTNKTPSQVLEALLDS